MSKEKQIEEMAEDLMACHTEFYDNADIYTDYDETAKEMYAKGYRKQTEGEWVTNAWDGKKWIVIPYEKHEHIGAHCSVCNKRALLDYDKDEVTSNFCPNCGAKMKGGE